MSRAALVAAVALAGLAVTSLPAAAQYDRDGLQRWIQVQNVGPITIREFYMTDRDTNHWGRDLLGASVVPPGSQMRVYPQFGQRARGYCIYDMRVVYSDNRVNEVRRVNLCEATAIRCNGNACAVFR